MRSLSEFETRLTYWLGWVYLTVAGICLLAVLVKATLLIIMEK